MIEREQAYARIVEAARLAREHIAYRQETQGALASGETALRLLDAALAEVAAAPPDGAAERARMLELEQLLDEARLCLRSTRNQLHARMNKSLSLRQRRDLRDRLDACLDRCWPGWRQEPVRGGPG